MRAALNRRLQNTSSRFSTLELRDGKTYAYVGRKAKEAGGRNARTKRLDDSDDKRIRDLIEEAYDLAIDSAIDGLHEISDKNILSIIDGGSISRQYSDYFGETELSAYHNDNSFKTVSFSHSVYDVDTKEEFVAYDGDASYSIGPHERLSLDFDMKEAIQYCGPGRKTVISRVDGQVVATGPIVIVADL